MQHNFLGVVDQHKRRPGSLTDNVYRIQTAAGDGHSAPEAINAPDEDTSAASEPAASPAKTRVQKAKELANRVVFGLLLGVGGAVVISYGKLVLLALCLFVTYQASVEYVGIMTSKQMSAGIPPPNRLVSAATTVMCVGIALFNHFVAGRSGTVLAVAGFLLLVLQVVANKRPKFSQLASSLFGLFYCGEGGGPVAAHRHADPLGVGAAFGSGTPWDCLHPAAILCTGGEGLGCAMLLRMMPYFRHLALGTGSGFDGHEHGVLDPGCMNGPEVEELMGRQPVCAVRTLRLDGMVKL